MARKPRDQPVRHRKNWKVAIYARLSREDGDKAESDSIANQRAMIESYIASQQDMEQVETYIDDGVTGTNFDRPDFQRMRADVEGKKIDCVIVKDLSRFGRDYIDVGYYLERWFPEQGVRFIAVNDGIDSLRGPYDMLLPVKNVFNEQYARDISRKVKSAFHTKQKQGDFIGAFSSYGYRKDPDNHNKLIIDPCAATVVKRIFDLFERGAGKVKIAKQLNGEGIPCPSEYKRLNGERYHNGRRMDGTTYWTYATIHRMLKNQMYAGSMEQGRSPRQTIHGRAKLLERGQWVVVHGTHEAIIGPEQWERVQVLLEKDTRITGFEGNVGLFAGFLRCGDCGRAMSKTNRSGDTWYCCGAYKRYGSTVCTRHEISQHELEKILLDEINHFIAMAGDVKKLVQEAASCSGQPVNLQAERARCQVGLNRIYRLKKASYEDYKEGLIHHDDYIKYKADYDRQEKQLKAQMEGLYEPEEKNDLESPWLQTLMKDGMLAELDRATLAETIEQIRIFEDGHMEITYQFFEPTDRLKTKKEGVS